MSQAIVDAAMRSRSCRYGCNYDAYLNDGRYTAFEVTEAKGASEMQFGNQNE